MVSQDIALAKIKEIIINFKSNYQRYKSEAEANTETKLIEPLFEAIGWNKNDFVKRDRARREGKRGIADYSFKIGEKIVFFLEVKKVGVPLDKEANKQVISYALSKRISFAVSTNFEQLNIFCVEQENAIKNVFRVFKEPEDYINNIHDLLFLSKESFEQNLILKKAEDEGRLKKRISIDKPLLNDLMHIRSLIAIDIEKRYPNKYDINEQDEIVQRILDRLIFIRRCEDIGINIENIKLEELRHLPQNKTYPRLKEIFKEYNDIYDSGLFIISKDNDCDSINISGDIIQKLAYYLYESRDEQYFYNFEWIDADVLGQVYEQYLGKILSQTRSGKAKLKEGQSHRKEQGIYYTPTYIVDYIVKNTLGELLKNSKVKLKVLDPACGSGSFLIKAFDYLYETSKKDKGFSQYRFDNQGLYSTKTDILKNNIYAVDLDNKAVEIARLNLLLKAAEKFRKLPEELDLHIRRGNSLVDDETIDKNAFNWKGDFQEGNFDVIISNPPYVFTRDVEFQEQFKNYVTENYLNASDSISKSHARQSGKVNLYALFLVKSVKLLKNHGLFGFIIPNNILRTTTYDIIRKFILDNCKILKIVDLGAGIFEGVTASTIILILEKENDKIKRGKNKVTVYSDINDLSYKKEIEQREFLDNTSYAFNITLDKEERKVFDKIEEDSISLGEETKYIIEGIVGSREKDVVDSPINEKCKKFLVGKDIGRYNIEYKGKYIIYDKKRLHRARPEEVFTSNKIIIQRISGGNRPLVCVLDNQKYYTFASTNLLLLKDNSKFNLEYITGLLNSKLVNYYYANKFTNKSNLTVNISRTYLEQLPIKQISETNQQYITKLVDKMISLNKELNKIGNKNTSETAKLKQEIEKIDQEIDEFVYKIYGITKEEQKVIEDSLK